MKNLGFGLLLLAVLGTGVWLSTTLFTEEKIEALYYTNGRELPAFELNDHNGRAFNNESLKDQWTLVFLGYTYCPDVCPTTMAELNNAYTDLAKGAQKPLKVLFVSVDPQRDTTDKIRDYVNFFNPSFIGATAGHQHLFPFARSLGMLYSMSDNPDNDNYLVDHSASVVVINPKADIQAIFKPSHEVGGVGIVDIDQLKRELPVIYRRLAE